MEAGYCRKPMKEATPEMVKQAKVVYNKYFLKFKGIKERLK